MMQSELVAAWRRSRDRLSQAEDFIDQSRAIELGFREQVYASRVLLLYASCQFAVLEMGSACVRSLKKTRNTADRLPDRTQYFLIERALDRVPKEPETWDLERISHHLQHMTGVDWPDYADLAGFEGNVWPDRILQYCRRFTQIDADFTWRKTASNSAGETYESRFKSLIAARNPLAHGHLEPNVLSTELMIDWTNDSTQFLKHVYLSIAKAIFAELPCRTKRIGSRDRSTNLGRQTVAMREIHESVRVGDFVILRSRASESIRAATVLSLMSNNTSLQSVAAGATMVAITLSADIGSSELYDPP